jgi:lysozyme
MITSVVDLSHWEWSASAGRRVKEARDAGIAAVIVKATQGKDYVDPTFEKWAPIVLEAGLLLGVYHFGSNTASGDRQADWFLEQVTRVVPLHRVRLALDFEGNPTPARTMETEQSRSFIHYVRAVVLRWPLLYGSTSFLAEHYPAADDPLGRCPLWTAAYGPKTPKLPRAWSRHELFQYTDGKLGPSDQSAYPRITPGLGPVDRSAYQGTLEELRAGWLK